MDTSELIGLLSAGSNAAIVASLGGDASWHVADDWGFGGDWKAVRVPAGIKFRRSANGLVAEEVLLTRGSTSERAVHERLLGRSIVPAHLVCVDRPSRTHNRLATYLHNPPIGRDG
jgi:hypothetical protein